MVDASFGPAISLTRPWSSCRFRRRRRSRIASIWTSADWLCMQADEVERIVKPVCAPSRHRTGAPPWVYLPIPRVTSSARFRRRRCQSESVTKGGLPADHPRVRQEMSLELESGLRSCRTRDQGTTEVGRRLARQGVRPTEVVSHAFSHGYHPEHTRTPSCGDWIEGLGGPATGTPNSWTRWVA